MSGAGPSPARDRAAPPARDPAGDVVRRAAFSCLLVPVVLVWCGSSPAEAAGVAFGLAAVTGACGLLMRRSRRIAAPRPAGEPCRGGRRRARAGSRAGRAGHGADTPVG